MKAAGDADRVRRAAVLAALGDPVRLAVVDLLIDGDRCPDSLAKMCGIRGNLLAHHLSVLTAAGLIGRRRSAADGRRTYLRLMPNALTGLLPLGGMESGPNAQNAAATGRTPQSGGRLTPTSAPYEVDSLLFVCTENSARSVLAEALWEEVSEVPASSAGTQPALRINPGARAAAGRAGLSDVRLVPQSLPHRIPAGALVVSVCDAAGEELAVKDHWHLHWSVPDPVPAGSPAAFDAVVAELRQRIGQLAPRTSRRPLPRRRSRGHVSVPHPHP